MANPEIEQASKVEMADQPKYEEVAALAYQYWEESGCVHGADQEHWYRAEEALRTRRNAAAPEEGPEKAAAAAA
jgi:hypothetical protein